MFMTHLYHILSQEVSIYLGGNYLYLLLQVTPSLACQSDEVRASLVFRIWLHILNLYQMSRPTGIMLFFNNDNDLNLSSSGCS